MSDKDPALSSCIDSDNPKAYLKVAPTCPQCQTQCVKSKNRNSDQYWICPKSTSRKSPCSGLDTRYYVQSDHDVILVEDDLGSPSINLPQNREEDDETRTKKRKLVQGEGYHIAEKRISELHESKQQTNKWVLENHQTVYCHYVTAFSEFQKTLSSLPHLTLNLENGIMKEFELGLQTLRIMTEKHSKYVEQYFDQQSVSNKRHREE